SNSGSSTSKPKPQETRRSPAPWIASEPRTARTLRETGFTCGLPYHRPPARARARPEGRRRAETGGREGRRESAERAQRGARRAAEGPAAGAGARSEGRDHDP